MISFLLCAGKSTLLSAISDRDLPIPDHIDIFHLTEEIEASDKTPLQCVMEVDVERLVRQLGMASVMWGARAKG